MSKHYQMAFSPNYDFFCVKPFVMGGKAYERGDPVDTAGIETRRLRQMYEARMVDGAAPAEQPTGRPGPVVPASAPDAATALPQATGEGLAVVHRGFGRYYVLDARGKEIAGPVQKEEAERLAAVAG